MDYLRLTPEHTQAAAEFAIEGMRADLYPMRLSPAKVLATIAHFIASSSDFHLAALDGPRIVGGIAAAVSESPWFERHQAVVVMCRAVVPGVGRRLIASLRDWMVADMRIRSVMFPMEFHADPRMARLLARYGFNRTQTVATYYK